MTTSPSERRSERRPETAGAHHCSRRQFQVIAFIGQLAENVRPEGPLFEVAVIHHNQCGTGALADDTFRRRYAERIGAEEASLREHAVLDPVATVARDVERLRSAPAISPRIRVSGHVYDVVTGLVQTVVPAAPITGR
jgi:carbonic anhydrase